MCTLFQFVGELICTTAILAVLLEMIPDNNNKLA